MISADFNKLKRLAYEYASLGLSEPQGEAILNFLKMPRNASLRIRDQIGIDQLNKLKQSVRLITHIKSSLSHPNLCAFYSYCFLKTTLR